MRRGTLALCVTLSLLLALATAGTASARVALVATGMAELALVDVGSDAVVARIALPAAARAVAVSADGRRGYVAAGRTIVALDVNERTQIARRAYGSAAVDGLAISRDGRRLYAVQGRRLRVLKARTLRLLGSVDLRGEGRAIALRHDGRLAAVVLARGRVAIVEPVRRRLLRRVRVPGAVGVAIADGGRTLVSARGRLRIISPGARRVRSRAIRLPRGAGGHLAGSPGRTRLAVGARAGGSAGALVLLGSGRVRRLAAGPGLGTPAWLTDSSRILFANRSASTLSLVSPYSRKRLDVVRLPGSAPAGIVVQPGRALLRGGERDDTLAGTRGPDRIEGLAGSSPGPPDNSRSLS